jgi:hypothetical protein
VTSRISHRRLTGGTALLSQRRGLRTEAEEEFGHIQLFRFQSDVITLPSADSTEQINLYYAWLCVEIY